MKTYDPSTVILNVGNFSISGFMTGDFISASRDEDTYKKGKGPQGDGWRTRNRNDGGKFVFTLQHAAPSNKDLSTIALLDEVSNQGVVPVRLVDLAQTTLWRSPQAWVLKPADFKRGDDMSGLEWTLDCDSLKWFTDGNAILLPND